MPKVNSKKEKDEKKTLLKEKNLLESQKKNINNEEEGVYRLTLTYLYFLILMCFIIYELNKLKIFFYPA